MSTPKPADFDAVMRAMEEKVASKKKTKKTETLPAAPFTTRLYKIIIQKLVIGKRETPERLAANRRVVIVSAETVAQGVEYLRDVLTRAEMFKGTTGEIVSVSPAAEAVVLAS